MALIAATALGVQIIKLWIRPGSFAAQFRTYNDAAALFRFVFGSVMSCWAISPIPLRFRRPCPPCRIDVINNMLVGFTDARYIDSAIALAWIVLATTRCWESEASWIDRLGRATGFLYIVMHAETFLEFYPHLF